MLQVVSGALTKRVLFEGLKATGVEYQRNGASVVAAARKEVVLSAGSIGSPHLLQVSGDACLRP